MTLLEERTARQLLKSTPKKTQVRSRAILVKPLTRTKRGKVVYETITLENRHKHRCFIRPLGLSLENIVVSCDCKHFKYVCEVSLFETNASIIKFSNGQKPSITNPSMKKKLCKHLTAVITDYMVRE